MKSGEPGFNSNYDPSVSSGNYKQPGIRFRANHNLHSIFNSLAKQLKRESMNDINNFFA